MSHRKPTKTFFNDDWRDEALCQPAVQSEPVLATAWDNVFVDWTEPYAVDPMENIAKAICKGCTARTDCLIDALGDNEAEGIRAGFRFNLGTVSSADAHAIRKEFGLKAKVRKKGGGGAIQIKDTEDEEM